MTHTLGWQPLRLGDECVVTRGISWDRSAEASEGVPALTIPNIQDRLDLRKLTRLRGLPMSHVEKARVRAGHTILVGSNGNRDRVGRCLFFKQATEFVFASFLMGVRPHSDSRLDARFVYYWLKSPDFRNRILGGLVGSTSLSNLRVTALRDSQVFAPPLSDQLKIAAILGAYDDLVENNTRRIQILEEMARALYRQWFVEFRFPGHEDVLLVESELGPIPTDWQVVPLEQALTLDYGKALTAAHREDGDVVVVGSSGPVGTHNEALVSGPGIVVGRKGHAGAVNWVDEDFFPIDTTFYVRSSHNLLFMYYQLSAIEFVTSDTAVPGLGRKQAYLCNGRGYLDTDLPYAATSVPC